MSVKGTKRRKQGKAARRRAARRQRALRRAVVCGCVVVLCAALLLALALSRRPAAPQNQWVIEEGLMEIAAPPVTAQPAPIATEVPAIDIATIMDWDEAEDDEFEEGWGWDEQADGGAVETADADAGLPDPGTLAAIPELAVPEPTAIPTPEPAGPVTITVTAAGDCTLGGSVHQNTYAQFKKVVQAYGYDYFFSNVRQVFERDDLTVLNLEGPITDVGTARRGSYVFKGDPDYVQIMTGSSVELCNVANNHSQDFGAEGLQRTAELLEAAGVGCCGYSKVFRTTIKGVRISALGYLEWEIDRQKIVEAVQAERPNCDILIVNMHWGREKHYEPVAAQKSYGHAIIDAGADLIIGTHPHVYGGVERYNGKYIVYSLGNFCFGGNANPSDKRCLMFQQTFTVSPEGAVSDGGINVIPCRVSSVANKNDYRPTIMQADDGIKLLKAMSKYSNFSQDTQWIANSYPQQVGLIATAAGVPAEG